ncbi:sigma-70 family RNA polymerase sigma factor [Nocardioides sp. TRM66260-LWL]|uniref:RNA polymerase sigma factor n=1 Tax=Nocardioides sp. TRM66260-LWL TaxID=2874478 RepID=UPI001CC38BDA|nr:sigma-70 family RNA polymerase sigma factor [Nocardioides sp. TRM66260-LWL]MBZ5733232.1 sigma-70 family RNA polymerase sigma factor [Nocardioides sp. TRM66260-LWL]
MDEVAFDDFYAASYRRLVGQLHAMIGDRAEAEECVQEAFARAWSHRRTIETAQHPEAWVRTTAYRLAVSRWRRVRLGRRPADRAVGAATVADGPDAVRLDVVAALARLGEDQRRALVLFHLADLSVEDVAREVGAPVGTVKARLSRGRAALARLLADHAPEGTPHA